MEVSSALLHYDIPDLLAVRAPRPTFVKRLLKANGNDVPIDRSVMQEEFAYTDHIYDQSKAADSFKVYILVLVST